jgi:hypothetical protein
MATPVEGGVVIDRGFRSRVEDRWREVAGRASRQGPRRSKRPELVEKEATVLAVALRELLDRLPEGGHALVMGHSPPQEAAVLAISAARSSGRSAREPACGWSKKPAPAGCSTYPDPTGQTGSAARAPRTTPAPRRGPAGEVGRRRCLRARRLLQATAYRRLAGDELVGSVDLNRRSNRRFTGL